MKIVGLMPVRNEQWALELTAAAALEWCDELVMLVHASQDRSHDIASSLAAQTNRVIVVQNPDPIWDEMEHRQCMLSVARAWSATHIAIIDADELLTSNLLPAIRDHVRSMPRNRILMLPGYNLRNGISSYHTNGVWGNRWFSVAFVDSPELGWSGDQFHHREPKGRQLEPYHPVDQGAGGVMHLWGASERRLTAKHALYKITEALRWPDKDRSDIERMYNLWREPRRYFGEGPWRFADTPADWWTKYKPLLPLLDVDAEPWQEAEVRRLVTEYGSGRFAGLDLFGVDGVSR